YAAKSNPGVKPSLLTVMSPESVEPEALPLQFKSALAVELTPGGYRNRTESAVACNSKLESLPAMSARPVKPTVPPPTRALRSSIVTWLWLRSEEHTSEL